MSDDFVLKLSVSNTGEFIDRVVKARQAVEALVPDDDMPEDSSYSTILSRSSRYLAEMLTACFTLGIDFCIQGNDNHEGYVHWTEYSHTDDAVTRYAQMQDAFTPASIAASTADTLAEVLAAAMNGSRPYARDVTHVIVIEDGKCLYVDSDKVFAENIRDAQTFLDTHRHAKIEFAPSYD